MPLVGMTALSFLQCFDTVRCVIGRTSSLYKIVQLILKSSLLEQVQEDN